MGESDYSVDFTFRFFVQHDPDNDRWRATESDNFNTWGFGDSAYAAIADLCEALDELAEDEP